MRFHPAANVTLRADDVVFRDSPLIKLVFALVMVAITIGVAVLAWSANDTVFKISAGVCGPFAVFVIRLYVRSLRESNWLMRVRENRQVFVKIRSYLNDHFDPNTPTVIEFERGDLTWVCELRRTRNTLDSEQDTQLEQQRFLRLGLSPKVDRAALAALLSDEHAVRPPANAFGVSTRVQHHPVRLMDDGVLQIEWRSQSSCVRPNVHAAMQALAAVCPVRESENTTSDYTPSALKDKQKAEQAILDLAASGETIAAIRIARELYSLSLRDAKAFVEELINNRDRPHEQATTSAARKEE